MTSDLRNRAEELLKHNPKDMPMMSTADVQKLVHELQVHQVELEMQNEELRQAQHELSETRDAYVELYDFAPVGYLTLDLEGRIVEANFTAATLLGVERGKLLEHRTFAGFVHRDALAAWDAHRKCLLDHRVKHGVDLILQRADGSEFIARAECTPMLNTNQEIDRCLMALMDISQRVQVEKALRTSEEQLAQLNQDLEQLVEEQTAELRESEERFRILFEESPDACFLIDLDGRFVDGNKAVELQTGYRLEELIGRSVFESAIFPPVARQIAAERIQRLEQASNLGAVEYSLLRKDGRELAVEVNSMPIRLQGKTVLLSSARDLTVRKQAEAERDFLGRQRQLALDAAELGWWLYNPETKRTTYDPRFEEIYGASGGECSVEELLKLLHPDDLPLLWAAVETAIDPHDPKPYVIEYRLNHPDGSQRWIEAHGLAEFEGHGEARHATGLSGTIADITTRKQTERQLIESETRFRAIFDQVPDGILMADPETGKFRMASQALCTKIGYSEEEVLELGSEGIHPAEDLEYVIDAFEKQARGEVEEVYDIPFVCRDGGIFYADMRAFRIILDGKQYLVGHVRDISMRKRMEDALHESEEKYRMIFESEADAILIFDGESRMFLDVNHAALEKYGYSREEFLRITHNELTNEPEVSDGRIKQTLAGHRTSQLVSHHRKKDGTVFPVEITACSFLLKDRRVLCAVIRDITEREKWEQELLKNREDLRKLASELSWAEQREQQRIATELHDSVSQMLSSASLRLDMLKESALPTPTSESVDKISEIVKETLQQIRSLTFELSCPLLHELGLVAALEELCSIMSHEHAVQFLFEDVEGAFDYPLSQQLILYRATRELLLNVMKHSQANHAYVALEQADGFVKIRVEDDGRGFDASKAGTGFSPSGGFGLFNLREHLQQAGGRLDVKSDSVGGTRVVVMLPKGEVDE